MKSVLKTLPFFMVFSTLLPSCSNRLLQIYNVQSKDANVTSEMLIYEDDTVKVLYNFWEENGRMLFAVQNKLDKAITIDWKKSNFSLNGLHLPYWRNEDRIRSAGSAYTWGLANGMNIWGFTTYASSSIVSRDVEKTHLPPGAWMERYDFKLQNSPDKDLELKLRSLPNDDIPKQERKRLYNEILEQAREECSKDSLYFPEGQSPVYFRNYLTIDFGGDQKPTSKTVDNSFEVRSVLTYPVKKDSLYSMLKNEKSAKRFYSLRKDMRPREKRKAIIDYPKNNITFGYTWDFAVPSFASGIRTSFVMKLASIELGYSHLFVKRLELAGAYGFAFRSFSATSNPNSNGQYRSTYYSSWGHDAIFSVTYFTNPMRRSRFSVGARGFFSFHHNSGLTATNNSLGGASLEIAGNFGGRKLIFSPFFYGGFQHYKAKVNFIGGTGNEEDISATNGVFGVGFRFRIPLSKKHRNKSGNG